MPTEPQMTYMQYACQPPVPSSLYCYLCIGFAGVATHFDSNFEWLYGYLCGYAVHVTIQ